MMTITGDALYIKNMNKELVLNAIQNNPLISRAMISKETGLNKGTVSNLTAELIDDHLIYETGTGESSGGRRPIMLMFNNQCGYAIGIDIGVNYVLGILTNLTGEIIMKREIALDHTNVDFVKHKIYKIIDDLISNTPPAPYDIVGIGISLPAIVDKKGKILFAPNLNWTNIDLKREIEQTYDIPVNIENEADAGVYSELSQNKNKRMETIIFLSVGMGIGGGIIINNSLFKGLGGFSGEVGHVSIKNDGMICSCGKVGCWELYASEKALLRLAKEAYSEETSLEELIANAKYQDIQALEIFEEIGIQLGIGIANIINIFNPSRVIIGNRIALGKKWIEQSLKDTIHLKTLPYHQIGIDISFSDVNDHSIPLGATYIVIDNFLEKQVNTI